MKQFNSATLAILGYRAWQSIAGLVTLVCITHFLTPTEQGYYYTFASLAALQIVLDMGLSTVLIQVAAHEFNGLAWQSNGRVSGKAPERFLALIRKSFIWYCFAAVVFLLAYPIGLLFFASTPTNITSNWHGAWLMLVIATSASLLVLPILSIIEGSGDVGKVYFLRITQSVLGAVAVWITLLMDGGLYAVSAMPVVGVLVAVIWIGLRRPFLITQAFRARYINFHWGTEIWPMQWRLGISWLCGYFLMQMHTPLLFKTQNPIVAGQMGVTMTVASMLSLLAMAWATSRTPALARAASMRDWLSLEKMFRQAFVFSLLAFVVGALGFMCIRVLLVWTSYGDRFLPIMETAGLLVAVLFAHVSGLLAVYLRAHRREPFMWPSVIGALLTATMAIFVAPRWGSAGIVAVLLAVNAVFGLPVSIWLWQRLRKEWHS